MVTVRTTTYWVFGPPEVTERTFLWSWLAHFSAFIENICPKPPGYFSYSEVID